MNKSEEGVASWFALLQAHSVVLEGLEADLRDGRRISLGWLEVLVFLRDQADGRLKMQDLAGSVLLSKSGVTRLVDRMVSAGLVRRAGCDTDRRITYAEITPAGRRALRDALPVHARALEKRFVGTLSEAELRQLRRLLVKVLAGNGAEERSCPSIASPEEAARVS